MHGVSSPKDGVGMRAIVLYHLGDDGHSVSNSNARMGVHVLIYIHARDRAYARIDVYTDVYA